MSSDEEHIPELERLRELAQNLVSPELHVRLVDNLPLALVVVDDSGKIVLFNQQAELMFGYTRTQVVGQEVEMLLPDTMREQHVEHRRGYMDDPRVRPMGIGRVLTARHRTGRPFQVEVNLSPVPTSSGTCVCALVRKPVDQRAGAV